MSAVTQRLRQNLPIKAYRSIHRGLEREEGRKPFRPGVKLCLERARLVTESYRKTEGEPMVRRRAEALANILEKMTIYIGDGQRIVGNYTSDPYYVTCYPECYWRWLERAVNDGYRDLLDDKGRKELSEILSYWHNLAVHGKERELIPDDVKPYWAYNGVFMWNYWSEAGVPDYEKLFKVGLNGLIEQAENRLREIGTDTHLSAKEYLEQKYFLEAAIIALKSAINWGKRYAEKARELARVEDDEKRKKELWEIAEICDRVPGNPPRTFHKALQFFWFVHLITRMIENYTNGCGVRFDQLMYPFYKKDREEGRLTRQQAQELLEFLWLKFEEPSALLSPTGGGAVGSGSLWQTMVIGGVTPEGDDATNEMSHLILEASKAMRTLQPTLALRYHDKIPKELIFSAIDLIKTGIGFPAFFNDRYEIPMLLGVGFSLEDARNYGIEACMRWTIPGKAMSHRPVAGIFVLPKCFELALNRGVDKFSDKRIGPSTPDPTTLTSINQVMEAYLEQVRFFADKLVRINNVADVLYEEYLPRPFLSAVMEGCIEKGKDCRKWAYFLKSVIAPIGGTTVADSMAAMKKLIFEEKRVTMEELLEALRNNWEGREEMRQMFLNKAPKFGNDDDYVDLLAREVHRRTAEEIRKFKNNHGFNYVVDGTGGAAFYAYSANTGATPDGRKDGEEFNDGSVSPCPGRDKNGPTATLMSTSKVDPLITYNMLLNQKFSPQFLEEENREIFAAYLKSWADLGHHHVQFNVIDRDTLLDAIEHPEKYPDLVVRVAGYSAYFVDLPKAVQQHIIDRTEQGFY